MKNEDIARLEIVERERDEAKDIVAEAYDVLIMGREDDDEHEARLNDRMIALFGGDYPRRISKGPAHD